MSVFWLGSRKLLVLFLMFICFAVWHWGVLGLWWLLQFLVSQGSLYWPGRFPEHFHFLLRCLVWCYFWCLSVLQFSVGVCLGSSGCCSSWLVKDLCTDQVGFLSISIFYCVAWFGAISDVYLLCSLSLRCAWALVVVAVLG